MTDNLSIVSKVLVYEVNPECTEQLKHFCTTHNLLGMRATKFDNIIETLHTNIDLGAVILTEEPDHDGRSGFDIIDEIYKLRKELPIFVRRKENDTKDDLPVGLQHKITGVFTNNNFDVLEELLNKYLFVRYYPSFIVRGILDISEEVLSKRVTEVNLTSSTPYLVKDRLIYGELFSLMALESNFCRGYMMLQTDEKSFLDFIRENRTAVRVANPDFRDVNGALGEITNLVWGRFKTTFFEDPASQTKPIHKIQVPIIINHNRSYITFGSEDPQLCFKYIITDKLGKIGPITIYQKFVFHLNWAPEQLKESNDMDQLLETGEVELF